MGRMRALRRGGLVALLAWLACTERALDVDTAPPDFAVAPDAAVADLALTGLANDLAVSIDAASASDMHVDLATDDAGELPHDAGTTTGPSWKPSVSGTTARLHGVWGTSAKNLWIVGAATLHGTGDPITWSEVAMPAPSMGFAIGGGTAQDFWFVGRYQGFAGVAGVAFEGTGNPTTFTFTPSLDTWGVYGMWAQSAESIWGVGDSATVVHGQGSPMSWSTVIRDPYAVFAPHITYDFQGCRQLFGIWGAGDEIWAVGSAETVLHGGADPAAWTVQHMSSPPGAGGGCSAGDIDYLYGKDLRGIWGASATDIWAVGHDGVILHGTGSPTSWAVVPSGTSAHLTGVWGSSATDVWAVGLGGTILHGVGSPVSWSASTSGTTQDLFAIWGRSAIDVWAVGRNGTILHYSP